MDDQKIRNFLVLAETLNYTEAAKILYKSQSVLSRQIASMEEELNTVLFDRTTHGVCLTQEGKMFQQAFTDIRRRYYSAIEDSKLLKAGASGALNIGILSGATIKCCFLPILKAFQKKYPSVAVRTHIHSISDLRNGLVMNNLDLVFNAESHFVDIEGIQSLFVGECPNYYMVSANHPLAEAIKKEAVEVKDFFKYPMYQLIANEFSNMASRFYELCNELHLAPRVISVASMDELYMHIVNGDGVTGMNENTMLFDSREIISFRSKEMDSVPMHIVWTTRNSNPCTFLFSSFARAYISGKGN